MQVVWTRASVTGLATVLLCVCMCVCAARDREWVGVFYRGCAHQDSPPPPFLPARTIFSFPSNSVTLQATATTSPPRRNTAGSVSSRPSPAAAAAAAAYRVRQPLVHVTRRWPVFTSSCP